MEYQELNQEGRRQMARAAILQLEQKHFEQVINEVAQPDEQSKQRYRAAQGNLLVQLRLLREKFKELLEDAGDSPQGALD